MNISKQEYEQTAKKHAGSSKMYITLPKAFLIGGFICCIGEFFLNMYQQYIGLDFEQAAAYTSVTMVFLSALLTGFGLYGRIAKHGGAGTLVPITGFANAVVSPALEFKTEGYVLGTGAKMFVIAGPVIVYGITAAFVYGIIYYIYGLFS
ncbi:MAG: stage V sporulation protein AC [Eubacterium sp.]|nr:stage V sporulation protein AC [Eubacterium sp.]